MILVDTKYEFGKDTDGQIMLIDEIHTPDSSRYFYLQGYEERQAAKQEQKQLSKEFVRQWLIAHGFQGLDGQVVPELPPSFIAEVSARYIELYETIIGEKFVKSNTDKVAQRVGENITSYLDQAKRNTEKN